MSRTARAALDAATSERDFAQLVADTARLNGWRVYRTWSSKHSPAGFPDLCMARDDGRLLFAELKRESGKPTAAQRDWLAALATVAGVEVWLWRPSDWPAIERELTR